MKHEPRSPLADLKAMSEEDVYDLVEDDLQAFVEQLAKPMYVMRMSRAMVLKQLQGDKSQAARSSLARYMNARQAIIDLVSTYAPRLTHTEEPK